MLSLWAQSSIIFDYELQQKKQCMHTQDHTTASAHAIV